MLGPRTARASSATASRATAGDGIREAAGERPQLSVTISLRESSPGRSRAASSQRWMSDLGRGGRRAPAPRRSRRAPSWRRAARRHRARAGAAPRPRPLLRWPHRSSSPRAAAARRARRAGASCRGSRRPVRRDGAAQHGEELADVERPVVTSQRHHERDESTASPRPSRPSSVRTSRRRSSLRSRSGGSVTT